MKKLKLLLIFAGLFVSVSCKKEGCTDPLADNYNASANDNDGSCEYTGQVTFWMSSGSDNVNVTLNGITSTISVNLSAVPDCGANGCANFTLPSGTYSYHAEEDVLFPVEWDGSVSIPKADCKTIQLVY